MGEKREGLISFFKHICTITSENTHDTEKINLNIAATTGITASGIGYSQFEELCSAIDVPVFTPNSYTKYQDQEVIKVGVQAVVSFNNKSAISIVQSAFTGKCPGGNAVIVERKRSQKRKINFEHPKKKRILKEINKKQHDYGPASAAPDISPQQLEKAKEEFMKNLKDVTCHRNAIERATVLQRDSSEWLELRKNLVTA
ncbi:unnamed protein product [Parnassius apollo]|uniref:(apollo) hypothetical protein n=1 Tax=Parnassius apollo TaxID=110799 RepID=A0A8S3WTN0_PARAO|nr:unnamed protein product [Parnassius apollo]